MDLLLYRGVITFRNPHPVLLEFFRNLKYLALLPSYSDRWDIRAYKYSSSVC